MVQKLVPENAPLVTISIVSWLCLVNQLKLSRAMMNYPPVQSGLNGMTGESVQQAVVVARLNVAVSAHLETKTIARAST